jgi:hypothetical protein
LMMMVKKMLHPAGAKYEMNGSDSEASRIGALDDARAIAPVPARRSARSRASRDDDGDSGPLFISTRALRPPSEIRIQTIRSVPPPGGPLTARRGRRSRRRSARCS